MNEIKKIYSLSLLGEKEVAQKMRDVNDAFDRAKKTFQDLKETLGKGGLSDTEIKNLKAQMEVARLETIKLNQERIKLTNQGIALNNTMKQERIERTANNNTIKQSTNEYLNQSKTLRQLKNDAKSAFLEFGEASPKFQKLKNDVNELDTKLKSVDKSLGDNFRNVGNYPTGGQTIFSKMNVDLKSLVLGYASFQAIMSGVSDVTNRVIDFDATNTAIKSISEETHSYAENQRFLEETTDRLGLKLLDSSKSFKLFFAASTQAGISAETTRNIYASASEAAATMKLSQDDANGVLLAFGQIASKGKVQAEELRGQIGERIPGAFGIAAKAMGVTTAELDKMMKDGKLMSNDFLPKFAEQLKKTYGSGQEPVKGLRAELNRMDNLISKAANNKTLINTVSFTITLLGGLASVISGIPFSWWIGMVGFLTLAYWENVVALKASIIATTEKIIVKSEEIALNVIGNALIITATILEYAQAVATGVLTASKWLLVASMNAVGISTVGLESAYLALNATFLATPLGWLILGITAIGAATIIFSNSVDDSTKKLKANGEAMRLTAAQMRVNAEIEKRATETSAERIAKLKVLTQIAADERNSEKVRVKTMEELIAIDKRYADAMDGNIIRTSKLKQITDELTASIKEQAKAEAIRSLLVEKQKQILINEQKQAELRPEADKLNSKNKLGFIQGAKAIGQSIGYNVFGTSGTAADQLTDLYLQNKKLNEEIDLLSNLVVQEVSDKNNAGSGNGEGEKLEDFLKRINTLREIALTELKKLYLNGIITETTYLKTSLKINENYNNQIIGHFNKRKKLTIDEKKLIAQTQLDTLEKEAETNEKLFKLGEEKIKQTLENQLALAQKIKDNVVNNPNSTALDKAESEKQYNEDILNAQVSFSLAMDKLEKDYNIKSKKNSEDRKNTILKIQTDLNNKLFELSKVKFESLLTAVDDFKQYRQNMAEIEASKKRLEIINDKSLTQKEKDLALNKINNALELANINSELGAVNAQINFYERRKEAQRLTNEELKKYNELLKEKQLLEEKKAVASQKVTIELQLPSSSSLQELIKDKIIKAFQLDEAKYGALLGNVIASAFDTASLSMNAYFESERTQVEASKKRAYERIDLEKEQLLHTAQSQAEKDFIEKKSRLAKEKADKEAGEKLKKIKKSEASIAFATELGQIAVAAASNPTNGVTFGASGIAMYAVLSGLALARYAITMANINKQQFGLGGSIPTRGGKFVGSSHDNGGIPIGMNEFEGDELAVINKKSAASNKVFTISGTPKQIASAVNEVGGGVSFAPGAMFKSFAKGGYFGSIVQPPVFQSYYATSTGTNDSYSSERLDRIEYVLEVTNNTLSREVHRKTVISSRDLSNQQNIDSKQSEIGTL